MKTAWIMLLLFAALLAGCSNEKGAMSRPNIIVILADDLGYGDTSAYGATEISTPNIDQLANEGLRFTQGYCTSATCSPSRYGLLTGQYPWKNERAHILPGVAARHIEPGSTTLPSMLNQAGYHTAVIRNAHLGRGSRKWDWNTEVEPCAKAVGFD